MRRFITIEAPVERVYAALSDFPRHAEWAVHRVTIEPLGSGPAKVGSEYTSTPAYATGSDRVTITELVPNESISLKVVMPNGFEFVHKLILTPDDEHTKVDRDVRAERLPGLMTLLRPLIPFIARDHETRFLENLKAALEEDEKS